MTTNQAIEITAKKFPFQNYMMTGTKVRDVYYNIAHTVARFLKPGSKILDFGSGPCDKTAILQTMGYDCTAYDDLQDDWHHIDGNRDKIIEFAKECKVNFKLATDRSIPFEKGSFDMVMLHSVIEHLHDSPRELLNSLMELTTPEGLLFITVPSAVNIRKRLAVLKGGTNLTRFEEYYWDDDPFRGHIREYVKDDLVQLSNNLNLEILELRSCDHMIENRLAGIKRPIYLFLTGIFRGWKDSWLLVAKKKPGWQPKRTLPKEDRLKLFPNRKWH